MTVRLNLAQFSRLVRKMEPTFQRAVVRGLQAGALYTERSVVEEIIRLKLEDLGTLRRSVMTTFVPDGAIVRVTAPHAAPLEYGARPFWPPRGPLEEWARRKGLENPKAAAWFIARKFARFGFPARRYFSTGLRNSADQIGVDIAHQLNATGYGTAQSTSIARKVRSAIVRASSAK